MLRYLPRLAATSRSVRFFATKPSAAYEQYLEKLQKKAETLGLSSVDELKTKLKDEIDEKKREFNALDPLKELDEFEQKQAEKLKEKKKSLAADRGPIDNTKPQAPYKTLSSFVDVGKMAELPEKELQFIWKARFQSKEGAMHATLNATQFANIYANAFKNPNFILPLPKEGQGYEMHFVQWAFVGPYTTHCMLTSLAEYKLHKEYAKPHTTLMFHQELVDDSGLVMMNGQLETDSHLTLDEAQLLVLNVQRFYGGLTESSGSARKLALLNAFTQGSTHFDMDNLIEEAASFD